MATIRETENAYFKYVKKIMDFNEATALAAWDMRTGSPKKGAGQRAEVIGTLSGEIFNLSTSEDMKHFIDTLSDPGIQSDLSEKTIKSVEESKREYERNVKIPAEEYKEYVILQSKAETVWEDAKAKSDFKMLEPYLDKIVDFKHLFVDYWGHDGNKYNTLLDLYEPGMTVDVIDRVFGQLRDGIIPLVQEVAEAADQPETNFLYKPFPKGQQRAFSIHILKEMGYDFSAGRLDETAHPFQISLNPGDVRVTTHYDEFDFRTAVFGTIHEGGHALYEQNISKDLIGTPLCSGTSMGVHESQSLFFENFVGRNKAFWEQYYDVLKEHAGGQFEHVSVEGYYRAINVAGPSLIRIEADEMTYPLHIIVRYEIEKALFNGDIKVKDLPGVWNEKMEQYLGIKPDHDREGVLQDIHWSGGDFGYFPSYALGYLYAAQFKHTLLKDLPDFDDNLRSGRIRPIREWLTDKIHQYGKLKKPMDILLDVTGEELNAKYLINYLNEKYRDVYHLSRVK
ncbi:carboxypeptidase Taq [Scopulibacillus darangshiensis]|uniref:Metal-dependent carboxypeptidase n=1 Tax=Scopulibacillus darangshiensis TaxID=442528 RepID=A0A4R2P9D9_9BACL|nr:carboxypeptidase M32 [Scopulibacillus darangshiensis]TCP31532.1 carboxypeptidase Taq [Scopulibacillus darangshiensis]